MRKVKLLLEDLIVESFEVGPDSQGVGTVQGLEFAEGTVHTGCRTHCHTDGCEACESIVATHCDVECPSWDGGCPTNIDYTCQWWDWTCDWECGGSGNCGPIEG